MSAFSNFYCPICFEKFNKRCHQPVTVSCGHTFCLYCLRQMSTNSTECVLCRRQINMDPNQFNKNIMIIELLEQAEQIGNNDSCMAIDCSICNPPKHSSSHSSNEQEEISEQEMIDEVVGDLEIFLQQRPETLAFMLEGEKRRAERNLLDAFFELIDECADERSKVLDAADLFAGQEIDEELRQVEAYAHQFETLCFYMITTVLRLRTLNSFTVYSLQRIRTYFPLRNRLEFVELTSNFNSPVSRNTKRLEDQLLLASQLNSIYRQTISYTTSASNNCDFIENIPSHQLYHCLICNCMVRQQANVDPINRHVQEPAHQFLLQEVERLPLQILARRSNAYRIQIQNYNSVQSNRQNQEQSDGSNEDQSRPTTAQQTSRSNAESRLPTFFS